MNTFNLLYNNQHINKAVTECTHWINDHIIKHGADNVILCPIMQSSFMLMGDICSNLTSSPIIDFTGVTRYTDDGADSLYIYKAPNPEYYGNKHVILLDVASYTGITLKTLSQLINELGAKRVYKAVLIKSQFCTTTIDWNYYTSADEYLFGYGLDYSGKFRNLKEIYYV